MTGAGGVSHDELRAAGLLVQPSFLDPDICAQVRQELADAAAIKATVARGHEEVLDEYTRRTKEAMVNPDVRAAIDERLAALRPLLAQHFDVALSNHERCQFLMYRPGDFFRVHQDGKSNSTMPSYIQAREVSVVVFLSRQSRLPEEGSYCGGALTFFRLPGSVEVRADLWGQEGLLVAFPADLLHEVRPVTHGLRASAVTWYRAPTDAPPS